MFKQNYNSITMQSTNNSSANKSNDIQNFSKLLKKLQTENVNIDELRLLKTEHTYLEKLRNQRQKVEELKSKFNQCEQALFATQQDNKNQALLIQDYQATIEMLKDQVESQRQRRMQLENTYGSKFETQKQKMKTKINELARQNEELKKVLKNKDIVIMQLQEQSEQKLKELKDHFNEAKRKLVGEIEERLKNQLQQKGEMQNEVMELRNLVTRQNKALKQQNEKYEQLSQSNNKLVQELQKCHQQIANLTLACEEYEQKMDHLESANENLSHELNQISQNAQNQGQLQELRKRMADMAKGEIQKIEFIVNEFQ